jgi:xylitol oxidase
MNKRTFFKICSAAMTSPFLSRLAAWASPEKLHNWAGNVEYATDRVYPAGSVEEVQKFVRTQSKLKVLGTRHCFNHIADSRDQFLSMKAMDKVVELNAEARTVTIESGMSYGKLCPILESKGWALHNLASLPHISVAGACSTATHGSGVKNGNLSTAVSGLEIVNAAGEVVKLSRAKDGGTFQGAVVGLGALGAVTKVTLDLQPSYQMQQYVYENLPLSELTKYFDAIESAAYSVSLFTDWQKKRINEVWLKHRMENGKSFDAPPDFYGAKRATKNLHPIAELSAENCTEQMGVPGPWYDRLPHFRMGFTPSAGKELQAEYFVARKNAVDAILAVEKLRDQVGPHLLITEIRTIAADNFWMSPCYKQDSVTIHFTLKPDWPAVSKLLPVIEKELAPFHARPHWGKLFTMAPAHLASLYEKLPEFVALSRRFDPAGKFHNDFLNTNVFGFVL